MIDALQETVRHLRLGMDAQGNSDLIAFVDQLQRALPSMDPARVRSQILPVVEKALRAQARGDFLYVADLLEHELLRTLDGPFLTGEGQPATVEGVEGTMNK